MRAITLSPDRLIASLSAFAGILDFARRAAPHRWNRAFARELGVEPGARWDVAMVQHCGYWSHFDHGAQQSAWPIESATTPGDLAAFGVARGLLHDEPRAGDIWLQYSPVRRAFVRAGVIACLGRSGVWPAHHRYFDVTSLEADTGDRGELGGNQVLAVIRRVSPEDGDAFLRWADAEPKAAAATLGIAA